MILEPLVAWIMGEHQNMLSLPVDKIISSSSCSLFIWIGTANMQVHSRWGFQWFI